MQTKSLKPYDLFSSLVANHKNSEVKVYFKL